ncbi:MAG: ATP-binding cassette domain-containing protein [Clostridia bacterium]
MVDLKIPQHGYGMPVTKEFEEEGLMFSGGEKQKISLVRSLTRHYPLIVLDEPTASLDPISEGKYIDAIYNSFDDSTVIMIAHRLSTIRNFDNILVLDNGRIVESGTHDELMKKHGMYYTMFMNQAKGYEDDVK